MTDATIGARHAVAGLLYDAIPSHPFLVLNGTRWEHPPKGLIRGRITQRGDRPHRKIEWQSRPAQVALHKEITPDGLLRVWNLEEAVFEDCQPNTATSISINLDPSGGGSTIARVPLWEAIVSNYGTLVLKPEGLHGEGTAR